MIITKQTYKNEIERLTDAIYEINCPNKYSLFADLQYIYAKNLNGRCYLFDKVEKIQLENLYADIINFISDNRLGIC